MRAEDSGRSCLTTMMALWLLAGAAAVRAQETRAEPAAETTTAESADSREAAAPGEAPVEASATAEPPEPYAVTVAVPEPAAPEIKRDAPSDTVQLEEVVVTATKREASVREIAGTVNAIRGEQLEDMGSREMQDYLKLIPGITLQEGDTDSKRTISIRGIGPQPNTNVTTGVMIENVSMVDPYGSYLVPDLDPFDLRDLEVLKGPQGTLFGANALNGAIRYVLNKPRLGVWEGKAFVDWMDVKEGGQKPTYGAALNLPQGEHVALRLAGVKQGLPGLYDDINANGKNEKDADEGDKEMYRALLLWQPWDEFTVNAFYLRQENFRGDLSVANNFDGEFVRTNTPGPSTSEQKFDVGNLELKYDLAWSSLISESSFGKKYSDINYDGSTLVPVLANNGVETLRLHARLYDTRIFAQELRLVSPGDGPWNWVGGVYYYRYRARFFLNTPVAGTAVLSGIVGLLDALGVPIAGDLESLLVPTPDGLSVQKVNFDPIEAREESVFGEVSRTFFDDDLEISLGGRYYREKLNASANVEGLLTALGDVIGASGERRLFAKGYNPKASIKYRFNRDFMVYTTAARGFQFGGLNGPAPIPTDNVYDATYDPSRIWSYELGLRSGWFRNKLQFDLTGFWIDWTDMQLTQNVPSGNTEYVDNISKARSRGLEASLRWLTPIPGLVLSSAAGYIRATIEEPYTTADDVFIPTGTELPASPRLKTTTALAYTKLLGAFTAGATASYSRTSKAYNNIQHEFEIYDYGTWDAGLRLGFRHNTFTSELSLGVINLTDEIGFNGRRLIGIRLIDQEETKDELANYLRPRTWMARLSIEF